MQKEEWRYRLWRWGFVGASVLMAAAYIHFAAISIVIVDRNTPAPEDLEPEVSPEVEGEGEEGEGEEEEE